MSTFDELVSELFAGDIPNYARGNKELEGYGKFSCHPIAAALLLPEGYAVVVLTERMNRELKIFAAKSLCGVDRTQQFEKLVERQSLKFMIDLAFASGMIGESMKAVLDSSRSIRNLYAHSDNPDDVLSNDKYKSNAEQLIRACSYSTNHSIERMSRYRRLALQKNIEVREPTSVTCVMVEITEALRPAAHNPFAVNSSKPLPNLEWKL